MTGERVVRRLAAILVADVAGYSRLMGRDEQGTLTRLKAHRTERLEPTLARHGGRLVKLTGDGALAEFPSAVDALGAAIEFQQAMTEANRDQPGDIAIVFRIGLHLGDLIVEGDDLYGDGVNVAARLEAEAPAGGIVISRNVHEAVAGRLNATFEDLGSLALKNIERLIQAFKVEWTAADWSVTTASVTTALPADAPLALPDKPSVAVLPFDNMSGDAEQAYFADGICEDLITALSRVSWLFVISRNSSFAFRGEKLDVRTIGARLGVRYLVEGSVRKAGERIRLTAQLIEASSGNHLWADKYDGPLDRVFELQDQITASLIGAIEPKLRVSEITRASRKRVDSLDAFDLVLRALPKQAAMTSDGLAAAIDLLDRAIALSPGYSQALAYGAWCRAVRPIHGFRIDISRDCREASDLARRALEAEPEDPLALRCAGVTAALVDRDYQVGWDQMDRSLAVDPNSAITWALRGWISIWAGEAEGATVEFEKAIRLSPFDHWISNYSNGMAFALNTSGRFEEGLRWARRAMQENPQWGASHRQFVASLSLTGRHEDARAAAAKYRTIDPKFTVRRWVEAGPFRRTPDQERFFAALREAGVPE